MAFHDGLFQLGMDLDRSSSTAQTEDNTSAPHAPGSDTGDVCGDFFCERDGMRYAGMHLIVDVLKARRLDDMAHIEATLKRCVQVAGATLLHIHLHRFTPNGGVSGVAVLAESHISIHSWPEHGYAALDIFMCGETRPHEAVEVIRQAFAPERIEVSEHLRGTQVSRAA